MKYAIVENGKVINIAEAEEEFAKQFDNWIASEKAQIGDQHVEGNFIKPEPDFEMLAKVVRIRRNQLLDESDWTQLPDAPVNAETWKTYRKSLRDIPQQENFPSAIQWPDKPVV